MSIEAIKNKLKQSSKQDKTWIEKAKYRQENEDWLVISFAIAVKVMSSLKSNKNAGKLPGSQKELAKLMECSPQYINKLLKGAENLRLETIVKLEKILNVGLIEVPQFETAVSFEVPHYLPSKKPDELVNAQETCSSYSVLTGSFLYDDEPNMKLVA